MGDDDFADALVDTLNDPSLLAGLGAGAGAAAAGTAAGQGKSFHPSYPSLSSSFICYVC